MSIFAIFIILLSLNTASKGDRSEYFQQCLTTCQSVYNYQKKPLLWGVKDDCKYSCMRRHTAYLRSNGQRVLQYYGKWPFVRILGLQEFPSVVFSLMNGYVQYLGYKRNYHILSKSIMNKYWLVGLAINLNAWIWSAIFHGRDKYWTERLDYFGATALIIYGVYYSLVALFSLYRREKVNRLVQMSFFLFFILHISKLLNHFDYGYNMRVMMLFGLSFNLLWIMSYIIGHTTSPLSWKCGTLFMLAGTLEIFDFPPIFDLFDSHSLWHLATIPITLMWWKFLAEYSIEKLPMNNK